MNIADLGNIEGPMLIFGGPYSNLEAFLAISCEAERLDIPAERMICAGDVVAYCSDAEATVEAIRTLGCTVVAGNCEKQLAVGAEDCGCGFEDDSQCSILAHGWYSHALEQVSQNSRRWMSQCPDIAIFTKQGLRYAVIHGGVRDISRFIWPTSDDDIFEQEFKDLGNVIGPVDCIIAGHSGIPFVREIGQRRWINVGSIGMPPNDGSPLTRFVILDDGPKFHNLSYDHTATRHKMELAGLTQGYHETLSSGFWPSEDTLPKKMRRG